MAPSSTSFIHAALLASATLALGGCMTDPSTPTTYSGPSVGVDVAAMSLAGVGDVVWDVEVVNGASPAGVVWQRRLTSSGYGDGAGSASFVGPCDASADAAQNVVKVWVVGVYSAAVTDAGAFASGASAGAGAVTGLPLVFQNPTATAPLSQTVTCSPNADAEARFDVAIMRPAQQGFFDIAVSFDDIFCSAKFDCAADDLLHDGTGERGATMVLGFACTAGPSSTRETVLYLDDVELDCTDPSSEPFTADLTFSPAGAPGNQCPVGALDACGAVTTAAGVDADDFLYQIGLYRGVEQLTSGSVDAQKVYSNVALGVRRPAIAGCRLRTRATAASDVATVSVDNGTVSAGAVYPYVQWDVALGSCGAEALTFGDPTAPVRAAYTGTDGGGLSFDYGYGASMPAGSFCDPVCENGQCVASACACDPGYEGATCAQPICDPGCLNGGTCVAPDACDCPDDFVGDACETSTAPWAVAAGGALTDFTQGVVVDAMGNAYVTGAFEGTATFGAHQLVSAGAHDAFVAKLSPEGEWLWARRAGGAAGGDRGRHIALDAEGDVYVTGFFQGNSAFGATQLSSVGGSDVFVAKLDADGAWLWAQRGGNPGNDDPLGVVLDGNGNIYVTGLFHGTATFGTAIVTSAGDSDVLVAKLDPQGAWLWARRAGGAAADLGSSLAVDGAGNIYIGGYFTGTASFGGTQLTAAGDYDAFVARLDAQGGWVWARRVGASGPDLAQRLVVDGTGGVYVTGYFQSTVSFGATQLTAAGSLGIFIAKIDAQGAWLWARGAGGPSSDRGSSVAVGADGDVYASGFFAGTADFGGTELVSPGGTDMYVARLTSQGDWLWARRAGGPSDARAVGVAPYGLDNVLVTGVFAGTATFGATALTSAGGDDLFVTKLSSDGDW